HLLKHGLSKASDIAKNLGLHRTNMYMILESLINKGIVSYALKENIKCFAATSPERLLLYLKEEEAKIKQNEKKIRKLIPDLHKLRMPQKENIKVEIYQGREGVKTILDLILKEGKDYLVLGYTGLPFKIMPDYFIRWQKKRVQLGLKRRLLAEEAKRDYEPVHQPLTTVKFLPDSYAPPTSAIIFGKKVWMTLSASESINLLIESEEVVDSYKKYFDFLWGIAKN
ncbi:MAG: hypothetical protein KKF89_05590, partial [Nanoarchaeota archaeon]|nr:hypothetical protein [Nanoarchaeota archaeon]